MMPMSEGELLKLYSETYSRKPVGDIDIFGGWCKLLRAVNPHEAPYANDLVKGWCQSAADLIERLVVERDELRARVAELEAEFSREAADHERTVQQRDDAEQVISEAFCIVIGEMPRWSNMFSHGHALDMIRARINELEAGRDRRIEALEVALRPFAEWARHRMGGLTYFDAGDDGTPVLGDEHAEPPEPVIYVDDLRGAMSALLCMRVADGGEGVYTTTVNARVADLEAENARLAQRVDDLEAALLPFAKWSRHEVDMALPRAVAADHSTPVLGDEFADGRFERIGVPAPEAEDYFGSLVSKARTAAAKAAVKFPQPNYVVLKIAEEAGEVVRGCVHFAEKRMGWPEVEGEIVQLLAMLIRVVTEGDDVNGVHPPCAISAPPAGEVNDE